MRQIIKLFKKGNVSVSGLRGDGKDMLMANVVVRRKIPYVSNIDYGGGNYADGGCYIPFVPANFSCGRNTYRNFISDDVNYYEFPYPDGCDVYISDAGIYFPAQYNSELNRDYGYFSTFMALSRQLGECNVHYNVQNLNRCWDKIREQSDIYIRCNWCKVFFGIVFQSVTIYDQYDACVKRVPPFALNQPLLSADRKFEYEQAYQNYVISHGKIKRRFLIYRNKSTYDTRRFKEVLANGKRQKATA